MALTLALIAPALAARAIDMDSAIAGGASLEAKFKKRLMLAPGRFGDLDRIAQAQGAGSLDGVVLDIGVSSMQLDQAERGFSFRNDGPLDMRMDASAGPTAADVLNTYSVADLARVLRVYGEERFAERIARRVVAERSTAPFETSSGVPARASSSIRASGTSRASWSHPALRSDASNAMRTSSATAAHGVPATTVP